MTPSFTSFRFGSLSHTDPRHQPQYALPEARRARNRARRDDARL